VRRRHLWLSGQTPRADREQDVGWWLAKPARLADPRIPQPLRDWLRVFDGSSTWGLLTDVRDAFTHRYKRRSITVVIGGTALVYFEANGSQHEVQTLMPQCLEFGNRRYSAFERALAKAYPLK
jgi:hypothetical protein